jgi:hypothetical protein
MALRFNKKTGMFEEASNSSNENSNVETIGGLIMLIISVCVFFFYAKAKFGIIGGIFYSLFWYLTIPTHYFFF